MKTLITIIILLMFSAPAFATPLTDTEKADLALLALKMGKGKLVEQLKGEIVFSIYKLSPSSNKDGRFKANTNIKDTQTPAERAQSLRAIQRVCSELFFLAEPLAEKEFFQRCKNHGWLHNSNAPGI